MEKGNDQPPRARLTVGDGFRLAVGGFLFAMILGAIAGLGWLVTKIPALSGW